MLVFAGVRSENNGRLELANPPGDGESILVRWFDVAVAAEIQEFDFGRDESCRGARFRLAAFGGAMARRLAAGQHEELDTIRTARFLDQDVCAPKFNIVRMRTDREDIHLSDSFTAMPPPASRTCGRTPRWDPWP